MNLFRFDRARVGREILATVLLALPLMLAQLAAIGSNVIDAVLAGQVSAHVLGAVAVGASIWSLAIVSGIGMMMSVPPSVSQLDGAGRRHEVGEVFHQAIWLALGMGVLLWFAVRHAEPLIKLPETISCEVASAMTMRGLSAAYLVRRIYPFKGGETVLLHAAAGGPHRP